MSHAEAANLDLPQTLDDWIAPDCHGENFFALDRSLQSLLPLYMEADVLAHLTPEYERLGGIAGGRLDELSRLADRHEPILHVRSPRGLDEDWIEFHPSYREMEDIGFGDFGIPSDFRIFLATNGIQITLIVR